MQTSRECHVICSDSRVTIEINMDERLMLCNLCYILLIFFVPPALGDWQDGDDGVDRPLGDLTERPITLNFEATPADCAALCRSYKFSGCKGWVFFKKECGGQFKPTCRLKATLNGQTNNSCAVSGLESPPKMFWGVYHPLPVGNISPQGWLRNQLELQANGLSGHLPMFWDQVQHSVWIGGNSDSAPVHENVPYWLNGIVPLAYQLGDARLISYVHKYFDYILSHQTEEGWVGPDDVKDGNMYWSKFPLLLALRQYHEANSTDTRVIPAVMKLLKCIHKRLFVTRLGDSWSGARWYDLVLTVHWMLKNHPSGEEQMLWDLAELLHEQGFDWKEWFGDEFPTGPVPNISLYSHGVNNGQAIKSEAVWYKQSQDDSDIESSYVRVQKLDQYHGQASGIFGCDEHLAGNMPSRGAELCTVVETMFSFEMLFHVIGDPKFAERAEQLTYNALPATITPDMWAHQYLQQSNQMQAIDTDSHVWTHDGPNATLFGLAPNYPCCTANFNQGWPKFTEHLVMETSDGQGLVVAMYAPAYVKHTLSDGGKVVMNITTDYPFDDTVVVDVDCGVELLLLLRIPSWADNPTVTVNRGVPSSALPDTLFKLTCTGKTSVVLKFPMKIKVTRRYNNAASIYRGPLLYGLHIEEQFKILNRYEYNSKDYQVTPKSPWNYAIRLSNEDFVVEERGINEKYHPFSIDGAPSRIHAKGRRLDTWKESSNSAAPPPYCPVSSSNQLEDLTLLPFGATDLRMAELPVLDEF